MTKTKEKINLILGFHCQLPSDIKKTDSENGLIKEKCDFIVELTKLLNTFQNIKISFHLSSSLISCLDKKHSDFSGKIRELLDRNQLELLSGGIYEPIFPFIP